MGITGASARQQHDGFEFAGFTLDLDRAALLKDGVDLGLRPQVIDVLCYLAERAGSLVTKEELLASIWGDKAVTDDSLTHCIIEIRKALDDADRRIIRTVPRRGCVFDIPVRRLVSRASGKQRSAKRVRPAHLAALIVLAVAVTYALLPTAEQPGGAAATASGFHDYYEQALFLFQRRAAGDLDTARDYFQKAIELEPDSAKAWAGLAGVYRILSLERPGQNGHLEELKAAAETAIRLDPENGAAWMRLAHYYQEIDDVQARERAYATALRVDPDDPLVLASTAGRLARNGDFRAAIDHQRRAVALQPLSVVNRGNLALFLFAAGAYEEAMEESRRAYQMRQATPNTLAGYALIKLERFDEALQVVRDWPEGTDQCAVSAMAFHGLGRDEDAVRAVEHLSGQQDTEAMFRLAEFEAFSSRTDRSYAQLERMRGDLINSADPAAVDEWLFRLRMSPFLAAVRQDPRWESWVQRSYDLAIAGQVDSAND